jgi:uncharacterized protein YecE (DUF72 family)
MKKKGGGIFRVGTSGIVVPGTKQSFPEEYKLRSRLNYYSSLFDTLEVNSSFYKVPMPSTCEKWSLDVPADFKFTLKLWKEITHAKELNFDPGNIDLFFKAADRIGNKKGCLLIQFPGKITLEYFAQLAKILQSVQELDHSNEWRKAVEFRNTTWYAGETYELLNEYGASMVLHDIPKAKNFEINEKWQFYYYRFHGPKGDYRGSYTDDFLGQQSITICGLLTSGKDVYAYFNNTAGSALENAMSLKAMVKRQV